MLITARASSNPDEISAGAAPAMTAAGLTTTPRRATIATATLIFLGTLAVFKISPNHQMYDSQFALLLADNILRHGDVELDRYQLPETVAVDDRVSPQYRLERVRGHVYYRFPPGSSVLSVPFVGLMRVGGLAVVRADGSYDAEGDGRLNARLASLVMAAFAALVFLTARLMLSLAASTIVAVVTAFGTQVYSSASRALGSDTWGCLLVGIIVFLLLRSETRRRPLGGVALGTLASSAYVVRPTHAVVVIALAAYLLIRDRRALGRYLATVAAGMGLFVLYSARHYGQVLPGYFRVQSLGDGGFLTSLCGHLVSPSRGLLIYVPIVALGVVAAARVWKQIRYPALARLAVLVIAAHLLVIAHYRGWGGHTFGPRLSTGALPWMVLMAVLVIDAARARSRGPINRAVVALAAIACLVSVAINTIGAVSTKAALWNGLPVDVDNAPERIWDWRQPQFLAPFLKPIDSYIPIPDEGIRMGTNQAAPYLGKGWSYPERQFRWTDGLIAEVRFAGRQPAPDGIEIDMGPHLAPGTIDRQRVTVLLNGREVWMRDLVIPGFALYYVAIPDHGLAEQNTLTFVLPDAAVPLAERQSRSPRRLGASLRSIRWARSRLIPDDGIQIGTPDAAPYLRAGWSRPEGEFRWTDGPSATIRFAGERPAPEGIEVDLRAYLVPGRIVRQQVAVRLNGQEIWHRELAAPGFETHVIPLAADGLREQNTLTFVLPDARSPQSVLGSNDERQLGIAVRRLRRARTRSIPEIWMGSNDADPYLGAGWAKPEGAFRWSDGHSATVKFEGENQVADAIEIELRPYLVVGTIDSQRVTVSANGRELWTANITTPPFAKYVIPLPAGVLQGSNTLTFTLPDAVSPTSLGLVKDGRQLGVAVRGIHRARTPL